jgi:hypothetical protein
MAKFVDNGRRNIADAIGNSLAISGTVNAGSLTVRGAAIANMLAISSTVNAGSLTVRGAAIANTLAISTSLTVSTTAPIALNAQTSSGGEAVYAECLNPGNNCFAMEPVAGPGDFAIYSTSGRGNFMLSQDGTYAGVDAASYGNNAYAVSATSHGTARGMYAIAGTPSYHSLYVDAPGGPTQSTNALEVNGSVGVLGNLTVAGSKTGYVVDVMQNVGDTPLEPGDVVTIVGNSAPVLGQIPVVTIKKADTAYDSAVTGIVDQAVYVPDQETKAAYDAQQTAIQAALAQRDQIMATANMQGTKPDLSQVVVPPATITDEEGTVHAITGASQVPAGAYANVVTLGSYKAVKVDASFGAIHPGDLLTSSPHAGYAMMVRDKAAAMDAVIGKALGGIDSGTGTIPVMVTLK